MAKSVEHALPGVPRLLGASGFVPDSESPFFMSKNEWVDLQVYVAAATSLPTTRESVRKALGLDADETFEFTPRMAGIFGAMVEHCHTWESETYPEVVGVAHRISEYATKFPARANALRRLITQIDGAYREGDDAMLERSFVTLDRLVQRLLEETRENQLCARQTSDKIGVFADQTNADREELADLDRDASEEMQAADEEVAALEAELVAIRDQILALQKEYTTAVVVAATTPTYLLVPIVGWIAIPIVAPIFGVRAGRLQESIRALRANVDELTKEAGQKLRLKALMGLTQDQIGPVREKARAAQSVIDKAHGIWEAIAADIGAIPGTLRSIVSDGGDPDALLMEMDLDIAVDQWHAAGGAADQFRVNAFVQFEAPESERSNAA